MSIPSRILSALLLGSFLTGSPARLLAATDDAAPVDSTTAEAPPAGPVQVDFDATVASKYLFQGFDYSDGKGVVQPNFVVSHGSVSAVVWSNFQSNLGDVNEVDLSLKYTRSFNKLNVSPGYTYLKYPNREGWSPSQEGFVDLGFEGPLSPTLSVHYDFDAGEGVYATLGLSHALSKSLSVATNLFYQSSYYGMTGIPTTEFKVSTSFPMGGFTMAPSLSRFASTENGDFTGAAQVPATWLIAIGVTPSQ
jgi:hypothetical protein